MGENKPARKNTSRKATVMDLFSGCGGLSFGFEQAGYNVLYGIDHWEDALETFKLNHPGSKTILADLMDESVENIIKKNGIKRGSIDVIVGGPPCQGFSISGKRNPNDPRNRLYVSFVAFLKALQPKAFVMENVPNLVSMQGGNIKDTILSDLKSAGYSVSYKILKASDYGVPQNRRRVFFVGIKNGDSFEFPEPTHGIPGQHHITSSEAISDLPEKSVQDGEEYPTEVKSKYQEEMRRGSNKIHNHEIIEHSQKTKDTIAMVPDGGNYKNLPKRLWNTRKVNIAWTRLNSKKPSYTIDTGHNHIFHYKFNRVPTARESARIQSFPDTFLFLGRNKASHLKQVGNAVPPKLAIAVAKKLVKYL